MRMNLSDFGINLISTRRNEDGVTLEFDTTELRAKLDRLSDAATALAVALDALPEAVRPMVRSTLADLLDGRGGELERYKKHLDDIRCDILDTGWPLGDDPDPELTPRRLVREVLAKVTR